MLLYEVDDDFDGIAWFSIKHYKSIKKLDLELYKCALTRCLMLLNISASLDQAWHGSLFWGLSSNQDLGQCKLSHSTLV